MADDTKMEVQIGAQATEVKTETAAATAAVQSMAQAMQKSAQDITTAMQSQTKSMTDGFQKISEEAKTASAGTKQSLSDIVSGFASGSTTMSGLLSGWTAPIAGIIAAVTALGLAFKEAINDMDNWVRSSLQLARGFGITAEDASTLKVMLERLAATNLSGEVSTQTLLRAYNMFVQKFAAGTPEVLKWCATWQGTGFDTFMKTIEKYQQLTDSTDKASMRTALFGTRLGTTLMPALANLKPITAEATEEAEKLGRVVGVENVAQAQSLSLATLHLHEEWQKLNSTMAKDGYPIWTAMKEIMASFVKAASDVITTVKSINTAIVGSWGAIDTYITKISDIIAKFSMLIRLGPGVKEALQVAGGSGGGGGGGWPDDAAAKIMPKKDQPGPPPAKTGKGGGGGGGGNIVQEWKAELDQMIASQKIFQDQSAELERNFYVQKAATATVATKEELDKLKAQEQAAKVAQLGAEKAFWEGKLALAGEGTKEYDQVNKIILNLDKQTNKARLTSETDLAKAKMATQQESIKTQEDTLKQSIALDKIDLETKKANLAYEVQAGTKTKLEELREYKALLAQEQDLDRQAAQQKVTLLAGDLKAQRQANAELLLLKKKQVLDMQKADQQISLESQTYMKQAWTGISSAFSSAIDSMTQAGANFGTIMQSLATSILKVFVGMAEGILSKWIETEAMKLIVGEESDKEGATSSIGASAGEAGAAGVASVMMTVPYPANIALAPAMGALAFAEAMSFAPAAMAAEGWWEVPKVTTTVLHPEEMVLPPGPAAGLRSMIEGGGSTGNNIAVTLAPNINYRMTQQEWHSQADMMLRAINRALTKFGKQPLSPSFT